MITLALLINLAIVAWLKLRNFSQTSFECEIYIVRFFCQYMGEQKYQM